MGDEEKKSNIEEKATDQPKKKRGRPPKAAHLKHDKKKPGRPKKSEPATPVTESEAGLVDNEEEFEIKVNIKGKPSAGAQEILAAQREEVISAISATNKTVIQDVDHVEKKEAVTVKEEIVSRGEKIAEGIEAAETIIEAAPVSSEPVTKKKIISDDILASKGGKVREMIAQEMQKDVEAKTGKQPAIVEEEVYKPHHTRSLKLYRKIAYFFVFLLFILFIAIFYFSYVKVKVILIPNEERLANSLIFDVYDQDNSTPANDNSVTGIVRELEISQEKRYDATGKDLIGQEVTGTIKIVNNYSKNQPLVASTRIMASDGKIFRLKNTVNVPAGGQVADVEIYADEPKQEMAIGPSKFTIPGLWAGLQDKIYAESSAQFIYGEKNEKHISQEDIDNGMRDIRQVLLDKAKEEVNKTFSDYSNIIYNIVDNSVTSKADGKAGEKKPDFAISMKAKVLVVAFNNAAAATIAKQKLALSLPENKELVGFDDKNIVYSLNNYNATSKTATVNASFEGKVGIKDGVQVIDKEKLIGLNKEQIDAYLNSIDELASHEVIFYPSFIKKIPSVIEAGKIEIEVKR